MQTISRWHSASYELKAKRQKLQATFLFRLPSLGRRPQAGGGCLSGSRLWAVGGGQAMHRHRTYCPSNDYNPTPALPIGEGVPSDASHEPQAFLRPRTTIHKLQTTGHRLQATCCFSSIPRTRPARPAEIRGPCRKRSRGSAVADVQMLERRGRFQTFPYRLRAESWAWHSCGPQATSHRPSSRHRHHVPGTTTTYHVPTGRTRGSAPTLRREKYTTNHEPKLQATSYRPLAAVSSFQPSEPIDSRELDSRPA